jgi:F0F1-type ATP synthase epsilon subunit
MSKKNLQVKLFCAPVIEKDPFRGEAEAVSSQNRLGKFDILPEHTNFITLIFGDLTIHTADKKKIAYQFERGVLEVSENKVNVFLGL